MAVKKKTEPKSKMYIYIGPPIEDGRIKRLDTFTEIPKELDSKLKDYPALKSLFIPIDKYPEVKTKLSNNKGPYKAIMTEIIKRGY